MVSPTDTRRKVVGTGCGGGEEVTCGGWGVGPGIGLHVCSHM